MRANNASSGCSRPLGMRYDDSYIQAYPFDKLVEGMVQPEMILETVDLMSRLLTRGCWSMSSSTTGPGATPPCWPS